MGKNKKDWSSTVDSWDTPEYNKWHNAETYRMIREHPEWYNADGTAKLGKTIENFDVIAYQKMTRDPKWWDS